jgi:L-asparaginase II
LSWGKGRTDEVTHATTAGYLGLAMDQLHLVDTRGNRVESRHLLHLAVTDSSGTLLAHSGQTDQLTFWRSTAKPFQLLPLLERDGAEHFGLTTEQVALACASHNGEQIHRVVGQQWLDSLSLEPGALSCGGHWSLDPKVARDTVRSGERLTPLHSNCSGNHAALLGLALREGWPTDGYQELEHSVQQAVADSVAKWSGVSRDELIWGIDGCTAAAVATPLHSLATAWARLGASEAPEAILIRDAMTSNPYIIAGRGRLDTAMLEAWPGNILIKVGAEGVYAAALPNQQIGIALKVEDGDMRAAAIAMVAVMERVVEHFLPRETNRWTGLDPWREPVIYNTRKEPTGRTEVRGAIQFGGGGNG